MKMFVRMRWLQVVLLLALAAGVVYAVAQTGFEPRSRALPGDAAPPFELTDLSGDKLKLSDLKGQGVLLNFWASWCNPCVNELPLLNEAYKLTGVPVLAINVGEKEEAVRKFAERYELAFPVLLDREMKIKQQYRVAGMPLTLLVDAQGKLVARHEGELTEMSEIIGMMEQIKQK
ncbi:redoxin domain-containing protein [Paenibacillus pinihumi]|uniref:redoxin domain-containing protein n=1 Tax=Paenibacillus pinihumi TaxID=669462 RepID=UPI00040D68EA|nr:redoxin domain-containing protein [Paenibacillus pinihumi]